MSDRSLPFDELGDRKPAPNPNHPQREIQYHRRKPNTPEAKANHAEHMRKLREQIGDLS